MSGSASAEARSYGAGARILTVGIASTGVFTFLYLALASHQLGSTAYGQVSLLWSVMFVIVSVIYRPIEQLLSRTIAGRRARGLHTGHPMRTPACLHHASPSCSTWRSWRMATARSWKRSSSRSAGSMLVRL